MPSPTRPASLSNVPQGTRTPQHTASRRSGERSGAHVSPGPALSARRRRVLIVIEDSESEDLDSSDDNDWATTFGALTISPSTSARRDTSPTPALPPPYSPPSSTELEQYYRHRYGDQVPSPNQIVRSDNRPGKYYEVTRGYRVGVFRDWSIVHPLIIGVSRAAYKGHSTFQEAREAYIRAYDARLVEVVEPRLVT
ncbi:hypothetical protein V5O48_015469 [Marasmius crinis-equi]|uniref:Ribonuclease H1 N-terminal domain-containing protein n=1 Tax=Marasmius crinis-equi TaxID=585013 RepID=A0ABR3EUF2_9AGAR